MNERKEWEPGINLATVNLGTAYTITIGDRLTHQVVILTPAELRQLRELLASVDDPDLDDPDRNREAARLKGLTLYNGHSLPTIDRKTFEEENTLNSHFYLEVIQAEDNPEEGPIYRRIGYL